MNPVFKIIENLGVIKASGNGWTKELNLVSWHGKEAVLDIRDWRPGHENASRGLTFTQSEMDEVISHFTEWNHSGHVYIEPHRFYTSVPYDIHASIGTFGDPGSTGWRKEINLVAWNGGKPLIDIRSWNHDHTRMTRGIALTIEDMKRVCELYEQYACSRRVTA